VRWFADVKDQNAADTVRAQLTQLFEEALSLKRTMFDIDETVLDLSWQLFRHKVRTRTV